MGGRLGGWDWLVQFLRISAKLNYNLSINMVATFPLYYTVYYIIMYFTRYVYQISAKRVSSTRSSYSDLIHHPPRLFIGPESDHWLPMSLTDWQTHSMTFCRLVWCEDANSKLVEVVTVADVDAEDRVGSSLLQIWRLRFGQAVVWLVFCRWCFAEVLKLNLGRDSEV